MGVSSRRIAGLSMLFALFLVGAIAGTGQAQSTVANPTVLGFAPSPDHDARMADGQSVVDHYVLEVYSVGASQPFQRTDIGKPAPASDGWIYYDFSTTCLSWPLPGGTYEARVAAVGPTGAGVSDPSNPFTLSSPCTYTLSGTSATLPAAGGGTEVSVTTGSSCPWTAASNVAWIDVNPEAGSGSGTVVAAVAANTSVARTGTLTVAGRTFTVTQEGAASGPSAPSPPASPAPAAGATGVSLTPTLSWAASGATSFSVRFGTANPPPEAATALGEPAYAPGTLSAGREYYWQVVAINASGSTAGPVWSFTTATSTPSPTLPSPWLVQQIGGTGLPGSASYSNGVFTVMGSGSDIWGTADSFYFAYQPLTGQTEIVVRLTGQQNTHADAKAGIMMREGLAADSAHATLEVRPNGSVELTTRSKARRTTTLVGGSTQAPPAWLKLARDSSTVTASVSADGINWRTVGTARLRLTPKASVGLAVTSHDQSATSTATFDSVTVR